MSRFSGRKQPGAARVLRARRRAEAEVRQAAERARDAERAAFWAKQLAEREQTDWREAEQEAFLNNMEILAVYALSHLLPDYEFEYRRSS